MQFCKKCKSIMIPTKRDGKIVLVCKKCGEEIVSEEKEHKLSMKTEKKSDIVLVEKKEGVALPTVNIKCPKCGYGEAYWWQRQMRAADEPPTTFFRCKKCGHTWREY